MRLIFIGPDCGGKSTLAEMVGARMDVDVHAHRKINDEEMRVTVAEDALVQVRSHHATWIRDQYYYPVDILYQGAINLQNSILNPMEQSLAHAYRLAGVIFVYVTASPSVIAERFRQRGDELWNLEQIQKVADAYESWYMYARHNHHLVRIDSSNISREEVLSRAWEEIITLNERIEEEKRHVGIRP